MLQPQSLYQIGVFRDGRCNGAIQIFHGLTLVAMVTKIVLFSHKIGHNWACTNSRAAEYHVFGHGQFNVLYEL